MIFLNGHFLTYSAAQRKNTLDDESVKQIIANMPLLLQFLSIFLKYYDESIRKIVCRNIADIIVGNIYHIQGMIECLVKLTKEEHVMKEAGYIISNAVSRGSSGQIRYVVFN
jgi:hypothetical protein